MIYAALLAAYVVAPFALGFVTGYAVPRRYRRAVHGTAVAIAIGAWIWGGWFGDSYDIGRSGAVVLAALFILWILAFFGLGVALGIEVRRRRLHPEDPELALGDRRVQRG